jgi:hypothetical protein
MYMSSKKNLGSITKSPPRKLSIKQDLLLTKIKKFFKHESNIKELLEIINGKTKLSLRIIDWFVTNYSKKKLIIIKNKKRQIERFVGRSKISPKTKKKLEENFEEFNVHLNYKGQLKSFQKKQFDPFCRRQRINFYYTNDKHFVTTVGQLNFFKWAIENNILQYIKDNIDVIEKDMNQNIKKSKSLKNKNHNISNKVFCEKNKTRQKRRELSNSATKTINKINSQIVLDFD